MKKISQAQVEAILTTVYQTNIPVSSFDAIRKLLAELPEAEKGVSGETEEKKEEVKEEVKA